MKGHEMVLYLNHHCKIIVRESWKKYLENEVISSNCESNQ